MGILQSPVPIPVTNGNFPQFKFAVFSDNSSTVTTPGYLNSSNIASGFPLSNSDVIMALFSFNQQTQSGTFGIFTVNIDPATDKITLSTWSSNSGDIQLPTNPSYLAHFTNTTGTISSAPSNVTQPGNISAGLSGTPGTVSSFPSAAGNGSLILAATNSGGSTTIISNGPMAQSTVYSIPDVGNATGNILVNYTGGFSTNAHLVQSTAVDGVLGDTGIPTSSVQLITQVTAQTSANLGSSGVGPITVPVTGMTPSSVIVGSMVSSSNPAQIASLIAISNGFEVTFTADPGSTCIINYIAYFAPQ